MLTSDTHSIGYTRHDARIEYALRGQKEERVMAEGKITPKAPEKTHESTTKAAAARVSSKKLAKKKMAKKKMAKKKMAK